MKVETQDLENRQVKLTVEVPDDRLHEAMRSAARRMSKQTRIPGFRPGKAPYEILLQRLGEEAIFEEALESLGQDLYRQALESTALEPFAPGSLDEVVSRTPLVLRYTVPLSPKVDLGGYREVRLPYKPPAVTDEAVEAFLEDLRQSQALIEPADRALQVQDLAIVDLEGELLPKEGAEAETLVKQQAVSLLVAEANEWPVPGLALALAGMAVGETKDYEYTFLETYQTESLRGRTARFHITCQEVKSRTVPDWTDELARSLGEYADLVDLRSQVRKGLEDQARGRFDEEFAEQALEAMHKGTTVTYPPQVLKDELSDMLQDLDARLRSQGMNLAEYLKAEKKTEQELRTELEPRARRQLERALVLYEIVEAERLQVEEPEIAEATDRLSAGAQAGTVESLRKALEQPQNRRRIAFNLLTEKALKQVATIARGEAGPVPPASEPTDEPSGESDVQATP